MTGWKDILRPIRDGYRHLFPSPDTGPSPEERERQRQAHLALGFTYFDTFEQLEAWSKKSTSDISRANTPLLSRPHSDKDGQNQTSNVLLCHDYSGNYHDYESAVPIGVDQEFYSCEYLQYVNTFVYFSHKLICVPPPSWTNTLHRNGVKVLGTLLVEPQTKDADQLLKHDSSSDSGNSGRILHFPIIETLSEIVSFYGYITQLCREALRLLCGIIQVRRMADQHREAISRRILGCAGITVILTQPERSDGRYGGADMVRGTMHAPRPPHMLILNLP